MNKYQSTTDQPTPQSSGYSDRQFLHTTGAGVKLPFLQALVTAFMVMIFIAAVIYVFDGIDYFKPMIVSFAFTLVGTWIFLQRRWLWLTQLEKFLQMDLDDDGQIGEPPKKITITVNRVKENGHVEVISHDFPVSDQQIQQFFTMVKTSTRGGKGISRRQWTPKNVHGFSEGEWDEFYKELVRQRLVMVKGNECVLTPEGEEIADGWYARADDPSPTDLDG